MSQKEPTFTFELTGLFCREMSWEDAVHWFDEAVTSLHDNDEGGEYDSTMDDPPYLLMAWQAEMYAEGGHGLDRMPERAGRSIYSSFTYFPTVKL